MSHYMTACPICNIVWEQCRCPDLNKEKKMELCPSCKAKAHEQEQDMREYDKQRGDRDNPENAAQR